ncbi:unnamed protein product, partial [Nippostrongylus brasiliensis]|uniref:SUI1 domain-containing protein n=1 Tax=Nippostrongylus brasiliensis TaxID=27835 RepID=A0A0N4XLD3_NIPBR
TYQLRYSPFPAEGGALLKEPLYYSVWSATGANPLDSTFSIQQHSNVIRLITPSQQWQQRLSRKVTLSRCPGFVEGGKGVVGQIDDGESANKKAIKKFLHRIKENIGIAERTEFSKTLTDAFEQMDKYKVKKTEFGIPIF